LNNLLKLFFKLDYRDKEGSTKKKLFGILTAYLLLNGFIAFNNYRAFDEQSYAILSLTTNIFLLVFIIINDFENLFLSKKYQEALYTLPVKSTDLFAAKFISAITFVLTFFCATTLSQAIFFYLLNGSGASTAAFVLCNLFFSLSAIGVLLLLYLLVLYYFTEKASAFIYLVQGGYIFFILYSSSLSGRAVNEGKNSILGYSAVKYLPQKFFAEGIHDPVKILISFIIAVLILFILYKTISGNYLKLLEKINLTPGREKRKSFLQKVNFLPVQTFIQDHMLKDNFERASYGLIRDQLRHSKYLRLKYIPLLFMPVLFTGMGAFGGLKLFLTFNTAGGSSSGIDTAVLLISPSITIVLIMCFRLLISNSKIADENSGGTDWHYDILPISNRDSMISGVNKYIFIHFIFPVLLIVTIFLLLKLEAAAVLLNIAYITSAIFLVNSIISFFDNTMPFSKESSRFNSATRFLEVLLTMLLGAAIFVSQIFIFKSVIFIITAIVVFTAVIYLLNRK
jgi:hypothetical protein